MIIRRIPIYSHTMGDAVPLTKESFRVRDFVLMLPVLDKLIGREQTLLSAEGALEIRLICRTLDIETKDEEMIALRRENCFDANEENEWILYTAFTTVTKEGVTLTDTICLPLSLSGVTEKPLKIWFNGTWIRILLDGEVLNENSGVGDLCLPERVECNSNVTIAEVKETSVDIRHEKSDTPANFFFPHGFNTSVGDVMTFFHDGVYHIAYLLDRRHHKSRGGKGAHLIAHLTTRDLITWEEQPNIADIDFPWETFGTGTMFFHRGKYYMSYGIHTSRHKSGSFIEPNRTPDGSSFTHKTFDEAYAEGGLPMGATLSVSDDGINFKKSELLYHGAQNPSVYSTADGGLLLYGGYGGEGVYKTDSIENPFVKTESSFVFSGPTTALACSSECPAFFEMDGYKYLIVGFSGYFRTLERGSDKFVDAIKLGENIYDGLCVPMVAEFASGRRIMAGWIRNQLGWGSAMLQRELICEEGGKLGMKWVPELYPETVGDGIAPDAEGGYKLDSRKDYLFEAEVEADEKGIFALDILGEGNAVQLKIDVNDKKAQLTDSLGDGSVAEEIDTPYEKAVREGEGKNNRGLVNNYAIPDVSLDRSFTLKIIFRYATKMRTTVCDIEIDGKRTMILSKPTFFTNGISLVSGKTVEAKLHRIK